MFMNNISDHRDVTDSGFDTEATKLALLAYAASYVVATIVGLPAMVNDIKPGANYKAVCI